MRTRLAHDEVWDHDSKGNRFVRKRKVNLKLICWACGKKYYGHSRQGVCEDCKKEKIERDEADRTQDVSSSIS